MPDHKIELPKEQLEEFCRRNHIRRLSVYGSILHGNFGPDSDVDCLVVFTNISIILAPYIFGS